MRDKSDRILDLASRKFKFIGCEIIYREACLLAARSPDVIDVQFVRKGLHDLKTADMLSQLQSMIDRVGYVQMGACEETPFIEQSRKLAQDKGWSHEVCQGRWTLLEKLFAGQWDDDFVIVQPGQSIVARNDEWVLDKK